MATTEARPEFMQRFVRLRSLATGEWLVDENLRPRLVEEAEAHESNLTETIVRILCKRYKVKFIPTGRRTSPDPGEDVLNLRLPTDLDQALKDAAGKHPGSWTVQDEIRAALSKHVGLPAPK